MTTLKICKSVLNRCQIRNMNPIRSIHGGNTGNLLCHVWSNSRSSAHTFGGSVTKRTVNIHNLGSIFANSKRSYASRRPARKKNYYDVLGISPKANHAQIKAAFYKLSKQFHPDVNKDESAKAKFNEISEAYEILGTRKNRHMYDRGIIYPGPHHPPPGETDEDIHVEEFWKRQPFKEKYATPPTGRSRIYDFDEFYRQHYGETLQKQQRTVKQGIAFEKEIADKRKYTSKGKQIVSIFIGFLIVASFMMPQN